MQSQNFWWLKNASKRAIHKTKEETGDLIGTKIADRITKFSKTSSQNNSVTNEEENIRPDKKKYIEKDIYLQNKDREPLMV